MHLRLWEFKCDCEACDLSTEFGQASNWRRATLKQLNECVDEHFDNPEASPFGSDEAAMDAMSEIVDLLEEEGLIEFQGIHCVAHVLSSRA